MRQALPLAALVPRPVLLVGLVMSLALLGDALLYVALPAHAAELGLPLWSVGILLGANRIVRLVTNGLAALAFARVGGRIPAIAATACAAVTTALYGLTPTFVPLLIARLLWGTCFSVLRLGSFTVVLAASTAATRGRLIGTYQSLSRIGPVASLLVDGLLVETIGFRATFALFGLATAPAVLLALALAASAYDPPEPHRGRDGTPDDVPLGWRERWLGGRRLVAVKVGMLAKGFASQGVVLATLTLALTDVAGTPEGAAALGGLLVAFRWGADLVLAPAFGHLSDRVGRGRMIPALLFAASAAVVALGPPLAFVLADSLGLRAAYALTAVLLALAGGWLVVAWRRPETAVAS